MKNYGIIFIIICLIPLTSLVKNTSKNLENEIYNKRESIVLLDNKYNLVFLENNYLTSPENLFKHYNDLNSKEYSPLDITNLYKISFSEEEINLQKFLTNE
tara:strand:- start:1186 stop:1488 length:303 start_codon:yes stop_codon:yes gene_type:complete